MINRWEVLGLENGESLKGVKPEFKTYADWKGDLSQYLDIGDVVDEEMADYFINVLPPATMSGHLIQMGEPYSHVENKATYHTLVNTFDGWVYAGTCHKGSYEHKPSLW